MNIKAVTAERRYKPGGGLDLEEDITIPRVASCHWYGPFRLLIICLVDKDILLYKVRGMIKKNLDIDRMKFKYKNPF